VDDVVVLSTMVILPDAVRDSVVVVVVEEELTTDLSVVMDEVE